MLFKSKADQESINRAQKMYGAGINRGLAGFVNQKSKVNKKQEKTVGDEIVLTTTENIPENDYRIIGAIFGIASQSQTGLAQEEAIKALRDKAKSVGADVVVALRFDSNNSTVVAYGTAVKLVD